MAGCEVRAVFRHAVPGGFFSRPEVSDVDRDCAQPAEWRVTVRGLDHGNHREEASTIEAGLCAHHLHAFQEIDDRLHAVGWSRAIHGPPVALGPG